MSLVNIETPPIPSELAMCPTHDDCFLAFMSLLPPGAAFDNQEQSYERDSNIRKFMSAIALTWLHYEDAICEALDNFFCHTADVDIDDWRADYGIPDECDIYNANVCAKVMAHGFPTAPYLIELIAANGYAAEGRWLTGNDPEFPGVHSTFRAVIDLTLSVAYTKRTELNWPLGDQFALGGSTSLGSLHCMLERYIPAHTVADVAVAGLFNPADSLGSKMKIWFCAEDTASGEVLSWTDRKASVVATASAGKGPTSALRNGFRYCGFDGVDDFMRTGNITVHPSGSDSSMCFVLFHSDSINTDTGVKQFVNWGGGSNYRRFGYQHLTVSGAQRQSLVGQVEVSSTPHTTNNNEEFPIGVNACSHSVKSGVSQILKNNDDWQAGTTTSLPALSTTPNTVLTIGANGDASPANFVKGGIRHLIITEELTPHEKLQLEAWLLWDIGRNDLLHGDHPYRNIRP